jgi:hypothetical protein
VPGTERQIQPRHSDLIGFGTRNNRIASSSTNSTSPMHGTKCGFWFQELAGFYFRFRIRSLPNEMTSTLSFPKALSA